MELLAAAAAMDSNAPKVLEIADQQAFIPAKDQPMPPWQGMQDTHNMFSGRGKLARLDKDRYPGMKWTSVRELLATR